MFQIKAIATILILALSQQSVSAFEIIDCTEGENPDAKLESVLISSCPDASGDYCILKLGTDASIEVDFSTLAKFTHAKVYLSAKIHGFNLPFPLNPSEACGNYGFNCPVEVGQQLKLKISLPLRKVYPKIKTECKLELKDENHNPIVCIRFPAKLQ